jgi:hypothetical protein
VTLEGVETVKKASALLLLVASMSLPYADSARATTLCGRLRHGEYRRLYIVADGMSCRTDDVALGSVSMPCVHQEGTTVHIDGCNLQITNGAGTTETANGLGNVIVGYNEDNPLGDPWDPEPLPRGGSHNVVVGARHSFTSWGGIASGDYNFITAPFASAVGGWGNFATAPYSSISGGSGNRATGEYSSVSGGKDSTAGGNYSSISGGESNTTAGLGASICGGEGNSASANWSSISGGEDCSVDVDYGWCTNGMHQP